MARGRPSISQVTATSATPARGRHRRIRPNRAGSGAARRAAAIRQYRSTEGVTSCSRCAAGRRPSNTSRAVRSWRATARWASVRSASRPPVRAGGRLAAAVFGAGPLGRSGTSGCRGGGAAASTRLADRERRSGQSGWRGWSVRSAGQSGQPDPPRRGGRSRARSGRRRAARGAGPAAAAGGAVPAGELVMPAACVTGPGSWPERAERPIPYVPIRYGRWYETYGRDSYGGRPCLPGP